jgi:hypothetical protein
MRRGSLRIERGIFPEKHFFEAMGAEGVFEAFGRGNLR